MRNNIEVEIYINKENKGFLGKGRVMLLELINKYGSILKAAKEMNMSYKAAWDIVDSLNNISEKPLVIAKAGGRKGGQTYLTEEGKKLIERYKKLEEIFRDLSKKDLEILTGGIIMNISARNKIFVEIESIKKDLVNTEIVGKTKDGNKLVSVITNEATEELNIKEKDKAIFIFKSSDVLISTDENLKISSRNRLKGVVVEVIEGAVNSEVKLKVGDIIITAVITNDAVKELNLEEGKEAIALIKATNILVAK